MKRKIVGTAICASIPLLGSLGMPVVAYATDTDCPRGYSCMWEDKQYNDLTFKKSVIGAYNTGFIHNDAASSVWNRQSDVSFLLYDDTDTNPRHGTGCVPRGYKTGNLDTYNFEDRVSSVRITSAYCDSRASVIIGGGPHY